MLRKTLSILAMFGLATMIGCGGRTSTSEPTVSDITPQTTAPSLPVVETDKILGAICTTVPKQYQSTDGDIYMCERNGSRITMQVNGPAELAAFAARFPSVKLVEAQLLCGDGWKLNFQKADYSPGDAGILYQELSKAGIPSESCS
jgi:hypothetical protein